MPVRIVIVDDHRILRDGLRLRLQQEEDFEVVAEAANAGEALACVAKTKPDLVLMDLGLPGESGHVATHRIRELRPQTRILVLTGDVSASAVNDALLAGANGFLRKEDASDELVRAVRVLMAGKSYLSPDAATAVTEALVSQANQPKAPVLTEQELAVLKGLADGLGYKEIADNLNVSVKSVESYRTRLVRKTGCATTAELVRFAVRQRLIVP
jgi:DNA-binding NarL/FixJ family response regulator